MMQGDVWSISPVAASTTSLRAAASAGAGNIVLLNNGVLATNGCGYQVSITSSGNESALTFTLVGIRVGEMNGALTTETITGPNATTVSSTNYYSQVRSLTISGPSVGNVSVGNIGSLALPRTRLKTLYYVGAASAGSIELRTQTTTGALVARFATPASSGAAAFSIPVANGGGNGLLVTRDQAGTNHGAAVVVLTQVSEVTLLCG